MNIAILLSGGTGTRMNASIPKQYIKVNHKMIMTYSLETLVNHPLVDGILIVADSVWQKEILTELHDMHMEKTKSFILEENVNDICKNETNDFVSEDEEYDIILENKMEKGISAKGRAKFYGFASPGKTRQFSILNALRELSDKTDIVVRNVLIHDAARPNLSADMITNCIETLKEHEGVMPVLPMKDTIYESVDGITVAVLLDRSKLFAGQAPEGFRFEAYLRANEALLPDELWKINGSTEPAIRAGMDVVMIPGDENNYKITTSNDLQMFQEWFCTYI